MILKELAVDHSYYCSKNNYYSNDAAQSYESWKDFESEYLNADKDFNFVFRWDIKLKDEEKEGEYFMEIFMMQQRKGIFIPIQIKSISEENVPQIIEYLKGYSEYIKELWSPIL